MMEAIFNFLSHIFSALASVLWKRNEDDSKEDES
ncbi:Uncharacterised protein [Staphylococcus muscae]|uniref:Uncharacterized protein n=1 Tax=Staphylococcus muscae TaxID=1294 RepID=A0A240BU63_9STAP|nr:Uncharacterised protein [Staphylococcus muscae]